MLQVPVESPISNRREGGLPSSPVELPLRLHFPSIASNSHVSGQAEQLLFSNSDGDYFIFAKEALVSKFTLTQHGATASAFGNTRPSFSGALPTSGAANITTHGLKIERQRLLDHGCSEKLVPTLLKARKGTRNAIYLS